MNEDEILRHFGHVKTELRKARKAVLEQYGLNEDSLYVLEAQALNAMNGQDVVEVPEGRFLRKAVPWYLHKGSELKGYDYKLTFIPTKEGR